MKIISAHQTSFVYSFFSCAVASTEIGCGGVCIGQNTRGNVPVRMCSGNGGVDSELRPPLLQTHLKHIHLLYTSSFCRILRLQASNRHSRTSRTCLNYQSPQLPFTLVVVVLFSTCCFRGPTTAPCTCYERHARRHINIIQPPAIHFSLRYDPSSIRTSYISPNVSF
jgi:hypothetical protein